MNTLTPPPPDPHPREDGLMHCPFCGEPPKRTGHILQTGKPVYWCECIGQGTGNVVIGMDAATWNRRTPAPTVADGVSDTELLDWLEKNLRGEILLKPHGAIVSTGDVRAQLLALVATFPPPTATEKSDELRRIEHSQYFNKP